MGYSINPTESADAIRATFRGLQAGFFALLALLHTCGSCLCVFCGNVRAILRCDGMAKFCKTAFWASGKLDICYLMSDDGAGFKSWAAADFPDALRLKCFQHVGRK